MPFYENLRSLLSFQGRIVGKFKGAIKIYKTPLPKDLDDHTVMGFDPQLGFFQVIINFKLIVEIACFANTNNNEASFDLRIPSKGISLINVDLIFPRVTFCTCMH